MKKVKIGTGLVALIFLPLVINSLNNDDPFFAVLLTYILFVGIPYIIFKIIFVVIPHKVKTKKKDNSKTENYINVFPSSDDSVYDVHSQIDNNVTIYYSCNDPLYEDIARFVIEKEETSVSSIQRNFCIGFARVTRIMDNLEEDHIIGLANGSHPREVLVKKPVNGEISFVYTEAINSNSELNEIDIQNRLDYLEMNELNDGFEFEEYMKNLLENNDFEAMITKSSNDYGIDVIAIKDKVKYGIQCKYYSSSVGVAAVQEVIAGKKHYECHVAVVATNNNFTRNAKELASTNNVILWDGDYINKNFKMEGNL